MLLNIQFFSQIKTDRDKNARKNFVDLIVKFAYYNGSSDDGLKLNNLKSAVLGKDSSFISVKDEMSVGKDFRFCEMATWGLKLNPSQKISCDSIVKKVEQVVSKVPGVNKVPTFG